MKKNVRNLFLFSLIFLIGSCASITRTPELSYEKDAIHIYLKSDPQLNLYQGSPHTLLVCVYQFRDPNAFNQLMDENKGLSRLLECSRFDPSVTSSKRLVIQPGKEITESLDRSEGAKYVGIAAGYYLLQKESMVRFIQIPVNFITQKPKRLKIDLYLGPQEIQEFRRK